MQPEVKKLQEMVTKTGLEDLQSSNKFLMWKWDLFLNMFVYMVS